MRILLSTPMLFRRKDVLIRGFFKRDVCALLSCFPANCGEKALLSELVSKAHEGHLPHWELHRKHPPLIFLHYTQVMLESIYLWLKHLLSDNFSSLPSAQNVHVVTLVPHILHSKSIKSRIFLEGFAVWVCFPSYGGWPVNPFTSAMTRGRDPWRDVCLRIITPGSMSIWV